MNTKFRTKLTGSECAAILVKCLPKRSAARIVENLQAKDLQRLTRALRTLPKVTDNELQSVVGNFVSACQQKTNASVDVTSVAKSNLNANQADSTVDRAVSGVGTEDSNPFGFLIDATSKLRKRLLVNEHPLNTAIVLSFLPTDCAAETLNSLEPEARISVLRRLCEVDHYDSQDVSNLSLVLRSRIDKLNSGKQFNAKGVEIATRMLTCTDEDSQTQILEHLESESPELAYKLEESVFKFADLKSLPSPGIKLLLSHVDTSCWAPALKNSSLNLKMKILNNLAEAPRELLSQEIAELGPVDSLLAAQAQQKILETCLDLQSSGEIQLPGSCTIQLTS